MLGTEAGRLAVIPVVRPDVACLYLASSERGSKSRVKMGESCDRYTPYISQTGIDQDIKGRRGGAGNGGPHPLAMLEREQDEINKIPGSAKQ